MEKIFTLFGKCVECDVTLMQNVTLRLSKGVS